MSEKIKLPLSAIVAPGFSGALQKLVVATDSQGKTILSGTDSYWLSKALKVVRSEAELHRDAMTALLRKYNAHSSIETFRTAIAELKAKGESGSPQERESLANALRKLPQLEATEELTLYKADPGYDQFRAEQAELEKQEVELPLAKRIRVSLDQCQHGKPETTLNAFDMELLESIVEFHELSK